MLDSRATAAWKDAKELWKAVSSHIVTARLKIIYTGQRQAGGQRDTMDVYLSIVSLYAPTALTPHTVAERFMDNLQDTLDGIQQSDILLLLGDLNARVGSTSG